MQGGHGYYGGRDSPPQGYGYGGYGYGYGYDAGGYYSTGYTPSAPAYEDPLAGQSAHDFPVPLNGLEIQPSETCPKNYVIFDQTYDRSRVMFHPSLAHKLGGSSGGYYGCDDAHDTGKGAYRDNGGGGDGCSARQEDTEEEIDALLGSEDGEEDDVVSTGRTPGPGTPDSTCSSKGGGGGRKKERMKKMVRTLKGIIPGGKELDTPAVLDEAVRYLKSLKVEAKKLGVRGSDS